MTWLTIDFIKLLFMALTELPLKPRKFAFFSALVKPLTVIQIDTLYKMQHDSAVISLEKMLNEYFDVATYNANSHITTRQVIIVDAPKTAQNYIYQTAENHAIYLGTKYLNSSAALSYQFIVKIPEAFEFDEILLRERIDYYKLAGKQYIIQTY